MIQENIGNSLDISNTKSAIFDNTVDKAKKRSQQYAYLLGREDSTADLRHDDRTVGSNDDLAVPGELALGVGRQLSESGGKNLLVRTAGHRLNRELTLERETVTGLGASSRHNKAVLSAVSGVTTEDHSKRFLAAERSRLKVAEESEELTLELLSSHALLEVGDDLHGLRADNSIEEEQRLGARVVTNIGDLTDTQIKLVELLRSISGSSSSGSSLFGGSLLLLFLLLDFGSLGNVGGVSALDKSLKLLALELLTDGLEESVDFLGDSVLEIEREEVLGGVGSLELLVGSEDHVTTVLLLTLDDDLAILGEREQDTLGEGEKTVILDLTRLSKGLLDLGDDIGSRLEKVDLGVGFRRRHLVTLTTVERGNHGVHEVDTLGVTDLGKESLGIGEDLTLIDTTELSINLKVLLIKSLKKRIEHTREERGSDLLDNLSTSLLGVTLGGESSELVDVKRELSRELEVGTLDEAELLDRDADRLEHSLNDGLVVLSASDKEIPRSLLVIKVSVKISEEDGHLTTSTEEISDLRHGDEVGNVRGTSSGSTPVKLEVTLLEDGTKLSNSLFATHHLIETTSNQCNLLIDSLGDAKLDFISAHVWKMEYSAKLRFRRNAADNVQI